MSANVRLETPAGGAIGDTWTLTHEWATMVAKAGLSLSDLDKFPAGEAARRVRRALELMDRFHMAYSPVPFGQCREFLTRLVAACDRNPNAKLRVVW